MPRTGRGGRRRGIEGRTYTNRTDLQNAPRQPVRAPTGMGYGERKALEDRQRAMPLPGPTPPPSARPELVPLNAPTTRPDEPLTAGASFGAGPGPEAMGMPGEGVDPAAAGDAEQLRSWLPALELLASQQHASPSMRAFVRRVRGSVPI